MAIGRIPEPGTGIPESIIAAKGDILTGTANDTPAVLTVGTNGHTLVADSATATGLKWAAPAGGGKVLQVVQATTNTNVVVASTVMADTGLSASITPSAATSKVLILVSQQTQVYRTAPTAISGMRIMRDATEIFNAGNNGNGALILSVTGGTTQYITTYIPLNYLDSPNTTSSVTYKTQACVSTTANGNQVSLNDGRDSSIILLEIGA